MPASSLQRYEQRQEANEIRPIDEVVKHPEVLIQDSPTAADDSEIKVTSLTEVWIVPRSPNILVTNR